MTFQIYYNKINIYIHLVVFHARLCVHIFFRNEGAQQPPACVRFFLFHIINALAGWITQAAVIARGLVRH